MTDKIPEGILIGIRVKNKKKQFCKRGHLLPARINGRRNCMVCHNIRYRGYTDKIHEHNLKANETKRKIRDSSFPMVERLKIGGILN